MNKKHSSILVKYQVDDILELIGFINPSTQIGNKHISDNKNERKKK